jgi:hypothetical protein
MTTDDNAGDRRARPAQPVWRRSSRSTNTSNCVEVLFARRRAVDVRDSKNPAGPTLAFPEMAWLAFLVNHLGPDARHREQ